MSRSLASRIAWLACAWALLASLLTASLIVTVYRQSATRDFEAVLTAHLFTLVAGTAPTDDGSVTVGVDLALGEARFAQPASGWYWSVEPIEAEGGPAGARDGSPAFDAVRSPSLGALSLPMPLDPPPFDPLYRRAYELAGPMSEGLRVVETEVDLGADGLAARFRVSGDQDGLDRTIAAFTRTLALALGVFALGSLAITLAIVRIGLRPLTRARDSLRRVREGLVETLDADVPSEIEPLVDEVNALIASNRRIVERARVQVGNLAHGLKTPLAVILNEAHAIAGDRGAMLGEQAGRMRAQIEAYLDRARIAASSRGALADTDAADVVEGIVRTVRKLRPDRRIEWECEGAPRFEGERHDLEELAGNLIENAAKWARRLIVVRLSREDGDRLLLSVEDDGPGMDAEAAERALQRGVRLDESVEGSGLGLSIVRDIASEYGGRLELGRSAAGGLAARVWLPRKPR